MWTKLLVIHKEDGPKMQKAKQHITQVWRFRYRSTQILLRCTAQNFAIPGAVICNSQPAQFKNLRGERKLIK